MSANDEEPKPELIEEPTPPGPVYAEESDAPKVKADKAGFVQGLPEGAVVEGKKK